MSRSNWSRRGLVRAFGAAVLTGSTASRVAADDEPYFYVKSIEPEDLEIDFGETYDVTATVLNIGTEGTQSIEYRIDDATIRSEEQTLVGAEEVDLTFEAIDTDAVGSGSFTHGVYTGDASATGTLRVRGTAVFEIDDLEPRLGDASPGREFTVTVTLTNSGDVAGSQTVRVTVDGEKRTTESVRLDSGATQEVSLTVPAPQTAGEYTYTVVTDDGEATGAVSVVDPTGGSDGISTELLLAAGGGGAVTLLGAYVLLSWHRSGQSGDATARGTDHGSAGRGGTHGYDDGLAEGGAGPGDPSIVEDVIDERLGEMERAQSDARTRAEQGGDDAALAACEQAKEAAKEAKEAAQHYAPERVSEIESHIDDIDRLAERIERERT